jgi:prefoldin subunit 5
MSKNADIKRLKEENEDLKSQIEKLVEKVDNLSQNVLSTKEASSANGRSGEQEEPLSSEKKKSVEFLSNQYDQVLKELDQIKAEIKEVSKKYTEISNAIAAIEDYSFNYNVKIVGMPVVSEHERADETVEICLRLFTALGVKDISPYDIDIAHRVPTRRNFPNKPNPIICKFTRRISKEKLMAARKNVFKISSSDVGFHEQLSLEGLQLYDHLSPRLQTLLREAKLFKEANGYKFCWAKNGFIFLRESESSRAYKLKNLVDLKAMTTRR